MAFSKPDLTRVWADGAPIGNVVDPDNTTLGKFSAGWVAEVPPFEHFNYLQKMFSQGLAYNNQQGINEWDSETTYPINAIVKGADGNLYLSILEQNNNNPIVDDATNWITYLSKNNNLIFNSVSQLLTLNLPQGIIVKTISYYDEWLTGGTVKGGGSYHVLTSSDYNSITGNSTGDGYVDHTLPNGNVAKLIYNSHLCLSKSGAVGDFTADDTNAIQAALSSCKHVVGYYKDEYKVTSTVFMQEDGTFNLNKSKVVNTSNTDGVAAIEFSGLNNIVIENGIVQVEGIGIGILCDEPCDNPTIRNIDFIRGAKALIIQSNDSYYPEKVTNINVLNCTHDGQNTGGFFTTQNSSQVNIIKCKGKNATEYIDLNNNVENVLIDGSYSEDMLENHWDINSARYVTITNSIIVSNRVDQTSRAVWISDRTSSPDPVTMPASEKVSHNVTITNCHFRIKNWTYSEFLLFNSGAGDTPPNQQVYTFANNTIESDVLLAYTKFRFQGAIANHTVKDNHFINAGFEVNCENGQVANNTIQNLGAESASIAMYLSNFTCGQINNNIFINYTGSTDTGLGGVMVMNNTSNVNVENNRFKATTTCAAFITENSTNTNNMYLENRYNVATTRVGGIRSSSSNYTLIYDGAMLNRVTFASGDATPDVSQARTFLTANAVATTITNFDGGYDNKQITVLINDPNTTLDFSGTNLKGNNGVDLVATQGSCVICTFNAAQNFWYCVVS